MTDHPVCCNDDCCGPGSYCCQHANPHTHDEVRIAGAPDNGMRKYFGCIGTVVGFSGQFVKVRFEGEGESMTHLFLPEELKEF